LLMHSPPASESTATYNTGLARAIVRQALDKGRAWLSMMEVDAVLNAYGIKTPKMLNVLATADEAVRIANQVGYPVALKIDSDLVQHKIDVGGVVVGLRSDQELIDAYKQMKQRLSNLRPAVPFERLAIQSMVDKAGMLELIVGSKIDSVFGPVIVFGQGGTAVEIIGDRAIGLPPLNSILAAELIDRTRIAKQMIAFRNQASVNRAAISEVLVALSSLLADIPEVVELDINPLCADSNGVIALDARISISQSAPGGKRHFAILPYPDDLIERVPWQGESVTLRPIHPGDEDQHRQFLERLSTEDIRMRVFFVKRVLAASELARLTQIDYARDMAFIAERPGKAGIKETLATGRMSLDSEQFSAEFAIVVRSDLKRQGLGRIMMNKLIRYARAQGLSQMVGSVLRENLAMRELALDLGFSKDASHSTQSDVVNLILKL
jgi:acetyltransferase